MLAKSGSTSKLPIDDLGYCSHISSANGNESQTVYSFLIKGFNVRNKNLTRLYVGVCKTDKISQNRGQPSTCCLCTWPSSVGFTNLGISFDVLLESTTFLETVYIRFSRLTAKFRKGSFFKLTF